MAIRPLDMQVMVQKLTDVAQMRQTENQRASVNQNNISSTIQHETAHNQQSVGETSKDQDAEHQADAKDEGKNKYTYNPKDIKKKDEKKDDPGSDYHKIDIKI